MYIQKPFYADAEMQNKPLVNAFIVQIHLGSHKLILKVRFAVIKAKF